MLYQLGPLSIRHAPFNIDTVRETSASDFVQKPVAGAAPPNEYVGEGVGTMTLSGTLFPKKIGGLTELAILDLIRKAAFPQLLLRGDGVPMGWWRIVKVSSTSRQLARDGVGQVVSVSIDLVREPAPSGLSLFGFLARMFG